MKHDHEAVRLRAIEIGVRPAARELGLNENTVRQWSKREQWFKLPPTHNDIKAVTSVTKPGDIVLSELAEHEGQTRLTLAKYAKNAAGAIHKSVHPAKWTKEAHDLAKTMAIVHRQDQSTPGEHFTLNVLNMGELAVEVRPRDADVDSVGSE